MGYMRHHAIVVTGPRKSYDPEFTNIHSVQKEIAAIAGKDGYAFLVSDVIESATNGYGSILIAPDGSKEGWEQSAQGDGLRNKIVAYLDSLRYGDGSTSFDYVEVQFGDDELETKICRDSDEVRRGKT
jgi:hypothetical protein